MADALTLRPHTSITVDKTLEPVRRLLSSLSPTIEIVDQEVALNNEDLVLRRQILRILLSAGYDITGVDQSRVTLAEIYSEAVK
jgi:hypothetical protein